MNQQQAITDYITDCVYYPYQKTGYYSKTITDYLDQKDTLLPFYKHPVSIEGLSAAITDRKSFPQQRDVLVEVLKNQYQNLPISDTVQRNIELLSQPNTFTITTAHQPVIFTGPLYFAYKILHTVKLAEELSVQLPENNFVPVYYMGSEDADLDELGTTYVDGKEYKWKTKQTGAVGRMKIDKPFIELLQQLQNQLSVLPHGLEMIDIFKRCYRLDSTMQQATLELVNELYGTYGVLVIIADNPAFKKLLIPVFEKEINEQFSHKTVSQTVAQLLQHYKVQASGRDINLFYLVDDHRERIEAIGEHFIVQNLNLQFTKEQLLEEINNYPERFSPNVILRGVLQETILPNIAFIGGGGELAYWLELKNVFAQVGVPYPVLVLRNSFLFITTAQTQKIAALGFAPTDFFEDAFHLINNFVIRSSGNEISIEPEIKVLEDLLQSLANQIIDVDVTLSEHTLALKAQLVKKLAALQKKILRAERRKFNIQQEQIETVKKHLFPRNSLQERVENISGFYSRYGKSFIDIIFENSLSLTQQFAVISL